MLNSLKKLSLIALIALVSLFLLILFEIPFPSEVLSAGATTTLHIVKYQNDGKTVQTEKTVDYRWMMANLPVQGDGLTHYYHQGPVFEGDAWDPAETINLKDKGAIKGTSIKDLCNLVGGMSLGSEVIVHAVDGWTMTVAYDNIYNPSEIQGNFVLCWFKGPDTENTENYESGYPADSEYNSAIQVVVMAGTRNATGQYVFGNTDMQTCMPQEKYQHFYNGLPSTNGLSGKWINELRIYSAEAPEIQTEEKIPYTETRKLPWLPIGLGVAGLLLVSSGVIIFTRKRN